MNKYLISVILFLNALYVRAETPICSVSQAGDSLYKIQLKDRTVDLIGWEHLDGNVAKSLTEAFDESVRFSNSGQCPAAKKQLVKAMGKIKYDFDNAKFVDMSLENLNKSHRLTKIGIEISPEEWRNLKYPQVIKMNRDLDQLALRCGNMAEVIHNFRLVTFGPELQFINDHGGDPQPAEIWPVESARLRKENLVPFHKFAAVDFDDLKSPYKDLPGFSQIRNALFEQKQPSEESVLKFSQAIDKHDPRVESIVRRAIQVWQERISGAYLRNNEIVKKISEQTGNVAIVIGHRHVHDLLSKIIANCQETSPGYRNNSQYEFLDYGTGGAQ